MDNILEIKNLDNYDYSNIKLSNPSIQNGNNYYTNVTIGERDKPLYIQFPKCTTKAGYVKNNSKSYTDLIFAASDNRIINWLENFETYLQNQIFSKKEQWFDTDIELDDIQELMTPLMRSYRSGKNILIRCNIKNHKCSVYNEDEVLLSLDNFTSDKEIIPLVSVNGIKFSSKNFTIELNLIQLMVLSSRDDLEKNCLIKSKDKKEKNTNTLDNLKQLSLENSDTIKKNIQQENLETQEIDLDAMQLNEIDIHDNGNNTNNDDTIENAKQSQEKIDNKIDGKIKEDNILLDIDSKLLSDSQDNEKDLVNLENLDEVDLDLLPIENEETDTSNEINIKDPTEIYYEIYKNALYKANTLKRNTIQAFLNAKNIKSKYNLEELDLDLDLEDEDENIEEVNTLG